MALCMLLCIQRYLRRRAMGTMRLEVLGVAAIVLAAGACATSTGGLPESRSTTTRAPQTPDASHFDVRAIADSLRAQQVADAEGPRVSVHVSVETVASSRRVRASLRIENDAYVVVGQLGPDGVVRIVFPTDPTDDGFVRGGKSYMLPEFSAGFEDLYRYRYQSGLGVFRRAGSAYDSYDGGAGYVFVIASWRPMRFDRFSDGTKWDTFEITDDQYLRDPRPAIYELATLLTGENREAYSVKFANYYSTTYSYYSGASMFSSAFCLGDEPLGYGFYNGFGFAPRIYSRAGNSLSYGTFAYAGRGYSYRYDAGRGCYRSYATPRYFAYSTPIIPAFTPGTPTNPTSGGPVATTPSRPPARETPRAKPKDVAPSVPATTSPEYRRRGLLTPDDGTAQPATDPRRPRREAANRPDRPAIQEMVNRRREMGETTA